MRNNNIHIVKLDFMLYFALLFNKIPQNIVIVINSFTLSFKRIINPILHLFIQNISFVLHFFYLTNCKAFNSIHSMPKNSFFNEYCLLLLFFKNTRLFLFFIFFLFSSFFCIILFIIFLPFISLVSFLSFFVDVFFPVVYFKRLVKHFFYFINFIWNILGLSNIVFKIFRDFL